MNKVVDQKLLEVLRDDFYQNLKEEPEKYDAFNEWKNDLQLDDNISMFETRANRISRREDKLKEEKAQLEKVQQEINNLFENTKNMINYITNNNQVN